MPILLAVILLLAGAAQAADADDESPRAVGLAAGLGLALPDRQGGQDVSGRGTGAYAEAEYIFRLAHWFTPRLYGGVLLAAPESNCGAAVVPCDVSARIFFAGAKFRLMAPIPYVGPFIELGIGASAGRISTRSGQRVDVTGEGLMYHVPVALGLALGGRHQFEVAFQYLFHPEQQQVCGAVALGVTLDL
jgi:hypothetical protein